MRILSNLLRRLKRWFRGVFCQHNMKRALYMSKRQVLISFECKKCGFKVSTFYDNSHGMGNLPKTWYSWGGEEE